MKKTLSVDQLLLDVKNPRLDSDESQIVTQADALSAILTDNVDDALTIAKDIVAKGLIESQLILVFFDGTRYIVKDGNRRIAALKLIKHPEFISDSNLRTKFEALHTQIETDKKFNLYEKIDCAVSEDEATVDDEVKKIHTGEQQGAGQKKWNAQQIERFDTYHDPKKKGIWLSFCEAIKQREDITDQYKRGLSQVAKTNAERALRDESIVEALGIQRDGNIISISKVSNELLLFLSKLINGELHVKEIYKVNDKKKFAKKLKEEAANISGIPSVTLPAPKPILIDSQKVNSIPVPVVTDEDNETPQTGVKTGGKSKSRKADSVRPTTAAEPTQSIPKRKTLIGKKQVIDESEHERINDIFRELQSLNVEKYPNAVAVLFRSLIEFGIDDYIALHGITFGDGRHERNNKPELNVRLLKVCEHLENANLLTKDETKRLKLMTDPRHISSFNTFNNYVHNKDLLPLHSELLSVWDGLWPFIKLIFKRQKNDND